VTRLEDLGYSLPPAVSPLGAYVTGVRAGDLAFFGGHGPLRHEGKPAYRGRLGVDLTIEDVGEIAVGSMLSVLASAKQLLGNLGAIDQVLKVCAFVACGSEEVDPVAACEPALMLLNQIFEQPPAVTIVPVLVLPNNIPIMLELIVKVRADSGHADRPNGSIAIKSRS